MLAWLEDLHKGLDPVKFLKNLESLSRESQEAMGFVEPPAEPLTLARLEWEALDPNPFTRPSMNEICEKISLLLE